MDSIAQTTFALTCETLADRLSTSSIDAADVQRDTGELFGMWRLAYRYSGADPRLDALNKLCFRLGDAAADLRALDPDATLRELYHGELNALTEQTTC
ncbi:hypothetical protein [Thiocapsa sp.]|uniref:hypothetical protein n=1 Tax=Thiocapsa sp. TaxID=2024551 RepID=UPI003593CA64